MSFEVYELPKAKFDKQTIFDWLANNSPQGAATWLDSYDAMIRRLEQHADSLEEALESRECEMNLKQALFKTKRGRVYRAIFCIENDKVYVLRVRGPGQAPIEPDAVD